MASSPSTTRNVKRGLFALTAVGAICLACSYMAGIFPPPPPATIDLRWKNKTAYQKNNTNETAPILSSTTGRLQQQPHFVPFPHNPMPYGIDAKCEWVARDTSNHNNNDHDPLVQSLLGPDVNSPDKIQETAFQETICLGDKNSTDNLHLFSATEAQVCLKGIILLVTGDSYNRQLYVGLADILLNSTSNKKLVNSKVREKELYSRQDSVKKRAKQLGIDVRWGCDPECRGSEKPFGKKCSNCLNAVRTYHTNKVVVPVVGAAVHIQAGAGGQVNKTLSEMAGLFDKVKEGIIFNSPPGYQLSKVPEPYKNVTSGREQTYTGLLDMIPHWEHKVRFLDYYPLTTSCAFDNCTVDGGHRARFVNRWKAQLLLNTICALPKNR